MTIDRRTAPIDCNQMYIRMILQHTGDYTL